MPDPPPQLRQGHGQGAAGEQRGASGAPELELRHVHAYYGASHVLQGVSLAVQRGEVVALLGRNGVGKTTTVHSVIGFTPPRSGEILFRGRAIHGLPPWRIARQGIGLVPQGRRIFPRLSVRENLRLAQRGPLEGGAGSWDLPRVHALFPVLQERGAARAAALSGGEQQMVAIARALLTNPALLLLDEPSEGLAPIVVEQVGATLTSLKGAGLSILLVEQYLPLALGVADRVYVMTSRGQLVFQGTPAELERRPDVYDDYLGV